MCRSSICLIFIKIKKLSMMPSKSLPGGEGAIGAAGACFFHPSKPICEKWPDYKKKQLTGVIILGQWERSINQKLCCNAYKCHIPEIEGEDFFIHPCKYWVDTPCPDPTKILQDDAWQNNAAVPSPPAAAAVPLDPTVEICAATTNVHPNNEGGSNDVMELLAQGTTSLWLKMQGFLLLGLLLLGGGSNQQFVCVVRQTWQIQLVIGNKKVGLKLLTWMSCFAFLERFFINAIIP